MDKTHGNIIECVDISKEFGEKKVLSTMNFHAKENEFVVILGPGQSGKSTLMRLIAGFEAPTTGHVYVNGEEVNGPSDKVGFVFQRYTLFFWKTVMGNVEMGPKLKGVGKAERRKMAQKYIDLVGLTGLDEPFGQLDAQTRILMETEIERVWQEEKRTILFVTSNIDEAIYLADRIIVLDGKLPSHLADEYVIDLPRPRNLTGHDFLELRKKITDSMSLVL